MSSEDVAVSFASEYRIDYLVSLNFYVLIVRVIIYDTGFLIRGD